MIATAMLATTLAFGGPATAASPRSEGGRRSRFTL